MPRLNLTHWYLKLWIELNITRHIYLHTSIATFSNDFYVALNSLLLLMRQKRAQRGIIKKCFKLEQCIPFLCYCYFVWLVDAWQMILHVGVFCAWMHVNSQISCSFYKLKECNLLRRWEDRVQSYFQAKIC